jgi:hypothetical protein
MAPGELEGWELAAMPDPRNWARPAVAAIGGAAAGAGLLLLGAHRRRRSRGLLAFAERRAADVANSARKIFGSR